MHNRLAGLALVLVASATATTAWAAQSPNHGPVAVSQTDTFPERLTLGDAHGWTPSATLDTSQVTTPDLWSSAPVDDAVEWTLYVGVDTAVVTSWVTEGWQPTDPMTGPDDVVHEDCYVLVGDTSYVQCLDGFSDES
jgi:hypothetical protein